MVKDNFYIEFHKLKHLGKISDNSYTKPLKSG